MVFWCLQFPPEKERKQVDLRYRSSSKVEFLHSFLEEIEIIKNPFEINWPLAGATSMQPHKAAWDKNRCPIHKKTKHNRNKNATSEIISTHFGSHPATKACKLGYFVHSLKIILHIRKTYFSIPIVQLWSFIMANNTAPNNSMLSKRKFSVYIRNFSCHNKQKWKS